MAHGDPAEKFPDVEQTGMGIFVDFFFFFVRDGSGHETVGQKVIAGHSRQSRNQGIESQGRLMCRDTG